MFLIFDSAATVVPQSTSVSVQRCGCYGELAGGEEGIDYDSKADEEDSKRITLTEVIYFFSKNF